MFGSLTSLTGGGGLSVSSSASADGDNTFANDFNYKSGAGVPAVNQNMILIGVAVLAIGAFVVMRKGR